MFYPIIRDLPNTLDLLSKCDFVLWDGLSVIDYMSILFYFFNFFYSNFIGANFFFFFFGPKFKPYIYLYNIYIKKKRCPP